MAGHNELTLLQGVVMGRIINNGTVWPKAKKMCEELGDSYKLASFEDGPEYFDSKTSKAVSWNMDQ
ncbi:hypothetical protein NECAME_16834 [Necator americanus]|uniref:C-type lectin domain-containing protein n=1 Tax=Necator americanus TaxID=51031 RepID=W2TW47_NECAM|nr:hypothetical protein NECAME_16834 [Necator americanus]ETN85276.1 hypothetical protein NECAME_16834 [Necator americanus]